MKKLAEVDSYYLTGPDGSGKTTILKEVERIILEKNVPTKHIWIRSPKIFSKPLMAICRLIGLTKYTIIDGIKYGTHEFERSTIVSFLFPLLQLIDFKLKWFQLSRQINSNEIVIFDRFSLDTLADLMVSTKRLNLHKSWIGKMFIDISKNCNILILYVDENTTKKRKKDTLFDKNIQLKNKVYGILSQDLGIKIINNNGEINNTVKEVIKEYKI